jgi:hypothetical protein
MVTGLARGFLTRLLGADFRFCQRLYPVGRAAEAAVRKTVQVSATLTRDSNCKLESPPV